MMNSYEITPYILSTSFMVLSLLFPIGRLKLECFKCVSEGFDI